MKERLEFLFKLLKTIASKLWRKLIDVKYKITFELYSAEREKNKKIAQKLKGEKDSVEKVREKLHLSYNELEKRNNTIKRLEEENKKLQTKLRLSQKDLEAEKTKNEILSQQIKKIENS